MSIYESLLANAINGNGGGGALVCNCTQTDDGYVLDKTVQEIYDAFTSGTPVYVKYAYGTFGVNYVTHTYLAPVIKIYTYEFTDVIRVVVAWTRYTNVTGGGDGDYLHQTTALLFSATSPNDYPVHYRSVEVIPSALKSTTGME